VESLGGAVMEAISGEGLQMNGEELELLTEILESECVRLYVEVRHTDGRVFRDALKSRIRLVEALLARLKA
jgi:hypothetical protein